jgi:mannose-6-phosphate isomerase-like protein (cupin superfamily)
MNTATEVKNLESADTVRRMDHGLLEIANLPGATVVRATLQPGWRWSTDVKPEVGTESCQVAHLGVVVSGRFHIRMDDGREFELGPGDAHVVAPGHDAWVVGDEPVVTFDVAVTGGTDHGHELTDDHILAEVEG